MKCINCEHFRISSEPVKTPRAVWELGQAVCRKHRLVTEFLNHGKLKKLECIERGGADG